MANQAPDFLLARIDRALARIEAAAARRAPIVDAALARRHEVLRARVEEAITALDDLIAREDAT